MRPTRSIRHGSTSTVLAPGWGSLVLTAGAAVLLPLAALVLAAHPWLAIVGLAGLLVRPATDAGRTLASALADLLRARGIGRARGRNRVHRE